MGHTECWKLILTDDHADNEAQEERNRAQALLKRINLKEIFKDAERCAARTRKSMNLKLIKEQ